MGRGVYLPQYKTCQPNCSWEAHGSTLPLPVLGDVFQHVAQKVPDVVVI